jgi:hypothetical protein
VSTFFYGAGCGVDVSRRMAQFGHHAARGGHCRKLWTRARQPTVRIAVPNTMCCHQNG